MHYLTNKTAIRHGDICFLPIDALPKLESKKQSEIHGGSHGHPHSIVNGSFYPQRSEPNIIGYLRVNKNGYLNHKEHGEFVEQGLKKAQIERGLYEVRIQIEDGHDEMREVVD